MSEHEDPDILEETSEDFLVGMWYQDFASHYGWFILAAVLLLMYYWKRIQLFLDERYKANQEKEYDAKCKKDPDWLRANQSAMEAARKKMQEEHDRKVQQHAEQVQEREEKRRQERLEQLENIGGNTLGGSSNSNTSNSGSNNKKSSSFKPEYHPLMGSGSSTTYRPPRRSCCPSGGCG